MNSSWTILFSRAAGATTNHFFRWLSGTFLFTVKLAKKLHIQRCQNDFPIFRFWIFIGIHNSISFHCACNTHVELEKLSNFSAFFLALWLVFVFHGELWSTTQKRGLMTKVTFCRRLSSLELRKNSHVLASERSTAAYNEVVFVPAINQISHALICLGISHWWSQVNHREYDRGIGCLSSVWCKIFPFPRLVLLYLFARFSWRSSISNTEMTRKSQSRELLKAQHETTPLCLTAVDLFCQVFTCVCYLYVNENQGNEKSSCNTVEYFCHLLLFLRHFRVAPL